MGAYRSVDGGATWSPRGAGLGGEVLTFSIDRTNGANLIAAAGFGIYRSSDAGATWSPVTPAGFSAGNAVRAVARHPTAQATLLVGGDVIFRTTNGGVKGSNVGAGILEVLVLIAEGARLLGAAGRVVLRIEIEDDGLLAAEVAELDRLAGRVRKREVRSLLTGRDGGVTAARDRIEESHGGAECHISRGRVQLGLTRHPVT
jgi:hypothetical protein